MGTGNGMLNCGAFEDTTNPSLFAIDVLLRLGMVHVSIMAQQQILLFQSEVSSGKLFALHQSKPTSLVYFRGTLFETGTPTLVEWNSFSASVYQSSSLSAWATTSIHFVLPSLIF